MGRIVSWEVEYLAAIKERDAALADAYALNERLVTAHKVSALAERQRDSLANQLRATLDDYDAARADAEALRVRRDELLRIAGENRADAEQGWAWAAQLAARVGAGVRIGCLCEWDEMGNPVDGTHGPRCFTLFDADQEVIDAYREALAAREAR